MATWSIPRPGRLLAVPGRRAPGNGQVVTQCSLTDPRSIPANSPCPRLPTTSRSASHGRLQQATGPGVPPPRMCMSKSGEPPEAPPSPRWPVSLRRMPGCIRTGAGEPILGARPLPGHDQFERGSGQLCAWHAAQRTAWSDASEPSIPTTIGFGDGSSLVVTNASCVLRSVRQESSWMYGEGAPGLSPRSLRQTPMISGWPKRVVRLWPRRRQTGTMIGRHRPSHHRRRGV